MIVDWDRHVGVDSYTDLFPHMTLAWRKHFERDEFLISISDASNHIRVSDRVNFNIVTPPLEDPTDLVWVSIPHQGLTINGWADHVAARTFLEALNSYGEAHWAAGDGARRTILVSPHDPAWSASEIRRRASGAGVAAVGMAPAEGLMGSAHFDPIYDACSEVGLPLLVHFSGVEGRYLGAPTLAGGVHYSALARHVLMPHLAESNLTSLVFEGTFEKFPRLQVLFAGFGFVWLMPLVWRLDREWRTFRHDVPWVKRPPSNYLAEHAWLTSHPIEEAVDAGVWARAGFNDEFADRIVFGSHAPFEPDSSADVRRVLGSERGERVLRAGSALLAASAVGGAVDGE